MGHSNLAEMFYKTCERFPDKTGMMYKQDGEYQSIKFRDMQAQVTNLAGGLASIGVKKGDKVVLFSENRYEWAFSDYAILSNGAVTVPIYSTLLSSHIKYIINDCDAKIVIVSNRNQFEKVLEIEGEIPLVEKFILFDPERVNFDNMVSFAEVMGLGKKYLEENPDAVVEIVDDLNRDNMATIIYTSGTTGDPKGVMLSHGNFLSNVEAGIRAFSVSERDTFLSFLPLSHIFERMASHFLANHIGATIAYAESIETVPQNLQEIKPTIMTSVPRLFEKIYAKVVDSVEEGSALKKKLFYWAIGVGRQVTEYKQENKALPSGLNIKYGIANKLVFSKLKERVGGRIRFFISGGAPLARDIGEFFTAAGLLILEGYGLTETSPLISINRFEKFKFGAVGIPVDNVEVKIAEDGEILTRGPHVMLGYYKNEDTTKEAIDRDSWFHTGDIGHIDVNGFLIITDRKKNIIVTAGGKNVAPQNIENKMIVSRYIEQVLVVGDKRKFCCSALIVPNFEMVEKFAKERTISFQSHKQLCQNEEIIRLIEVEVEAASKGLASYESIKEFILLDRPFSIESGELTPSLKVKRKVVEENYEEEINSMYEEESVKV